MRLLEAAAHGLARAAGWLASAATLLCLLLVCVSVAARYLFAAPMGWSDKVAGWLVIALVLLAAPEAQRRFEHIGVDVAVGRIGPRLARWAHLLGAVSVALVAAILLSAGMEAVQFSRMIGMMTDVEGVPEWWIQALLPAGAALLLLVALAQATALAVGREPPHLPRGGSEEALDADKVARAE